MSTRFKPATSPVILALGMALCGIAAAADEPSPHYYLGLQAGRNNLDNWNADVSFGAGVTLPGKVELDQGMHGGLVFGRQTEHARYEIEYQRGSFDLQSIELGPLKEAAGGSGHYEALTLSAYRTERLSDSVSGYLGAGIGFGKTKLPSASFSTGCHCFPAASGNGLAWQLRAGLEYDFAAAHKGFIQYTHLGLPSPDSGSTPGVDYDRKQIGIIGLGYRYVFP